VLVKCLSRDKATYILNELHISVCGAHQVGLKLTDQIKGWAIIDQLWFTIQ